MDLVTGFAPRRVLVKLKHYHFYPLTVFTCMKFTVFNICSLLGHTFHFMITCHIEQNRQIKFRIGVYLALVDTGVPWLSVLDPQIPVIAARRMKDREALIPGVGINVGGQYMQIAFTHPRYCAISFVLYATFHNGCLIGHDGNILTMAIIEIRTLVDSGTLQTQHFPLTKLME